MIPTCASRHTPADRHDADRVSRLANAGGAALSISPCAGSQSPNAEQLPLSG